MFVMIVWRVMLLNSGVLASSSWLAPTYFRIESRSAGAKPATIHSTSPFLLALWTPKYDFSGVDRSHRSRLIIFTSIAFTSIAGSSLISCAAGSGHASEAGGSMDARTVGKAQREGPSAPLLVFAPPWVTSGSGD